LIYQIKKTTSDVITARGPETSKKNNQLGLTHTHTHTHTHTYVPILRSFTSLLLQITKEEHFIGTFDVL